MTLFTWKPKQHSKKRERYEGMGLSAALREPLLSDDNKQEERYQTIRLNYECQRAQQLKPQRKKEIDELRLEILATLSTLPNEGANHTKDTINEIYRKVCTLPQTQLHHVPRQNYDILDLRLKYEMAVKKHKDDTGQESKGDTQKIEQNCSYT